MEMIPPMISMVREIKNVWTISRLRMVWIPMMALLLRETRSTQIFRWYAITVSLVPSRFRNEKYR